MSISSLQDHAQHPRHRYEILERFIVGHAANPMCADVIDVGLVIENGTIREAGFSGNGCALCIGSSSLLCEYLQGRQLKELDLSALPHLAGEQIGRMREGCVTVSVIACKRALSSYASLS